MLRSDHARLFLVWTVILGTTLLAVVGQSMRHDDASETPAAASATSDAAPVVPVTLKAEVEGRLTMALDVLRRFGPGVTSSQVLEAAEALARADAPFASRVAYAVLVGEVEGTGSGLGRLGDLKAQTDAESRLLAEVESRMRRLAESEAADAQSAKADAETETDAETEPDAQTRADTGREAADVDRVLGYFARLLDPEDRSAARAEGMPLLIALVAAGLWYLVAFLAGLVVLIALAALLVLGRIKPRLRPAEPRGKAIVLGEAFAAWIVAFLASNLILAVVVEALPDHPAVPLALSLVAFFASLAVIPVVASLRGISFAELRGLVGLHAGRGLVVESLHGVACYVGAVPLLVVGLVVYLALATLWRHMTGAESAPSHPAIEQLVSAGPLGIALLFALASVAAPIVEEIAFRGLLYGHVRGIALRTNRFLSAGLAAVVSSLIFAVIHPQGVLFVPALGGLAVGFCIYREVRGSLVAPMVAHAIQNAVTLSIALLVLA